MLQPAHLDLSSWPPCAWAASAAVPIASLICTTILAKHAAHGWLRRNWCYIHLLYIDKFRPHSLQRKTWPSTCKPKGLIFSLGRRQTRRLITDDPWADSPIATSPSHCLFQGTPGGGTAGHQSVQDTSSVPKKENIRDLFRHSPTPFRIASRSG